jgi:hypothetical protein
LPNTPRRAKKGRRGGAPERAYRAREPALAEREQKRKAVEEERRKGAAAAQQKLRQMEVCCMGIKSAAMPTRSAY